MASDDLGASLREAEEGSLKHPLSRLLPSSGARNLSKPPPALIGSSYNDSEGLFKTEEPSRDDGRDNSEQFTPTPEHGQLASRVERILQLPKPPHSMQHSELKRRLDEDSDPNVTLALVQQLSQHVADLQDQLDSRTRQQNAREAALKELIKSSKSVEITEGMVERALARAGADAHAGKSAAVNATDSSRHSSKPWRILLSLPVDALKDERRSTVKPKQIHMLDDDLYDAMEASDIRGEIVPSPNRRFSGTPLATIHDVKKATRRPNGSDQSYAAGTKPRAGSIRSVASVSSQVSSRKSISTWAGHIFGWSGTEERQTICGNDSASDDSEGSEVGGAHERRIKRKGTVKRLHTNAGFETSRRRSQSRSSAFAAAPNGIGPTEHVKGSHHSAPDHNVDAEIRSPVSVLLSRRSSGMHPEAAVTTDVVPTAVGSNSLQHSSASVLQAFAGSQLHQTTDDPPQPSHFRAISESASTIGKSRSRSGAGNVYQSPARVSQNISNWTDKLLTSFQPSSLDSGMPSQASLDTLASSAIQRRQSQSPSVTSNRSPSPRIGKTYLRAGPSIATMDKEASPEPVKLSANPHPSTTTYSPVEDDAMLLASSGSPKQKGYLSSAKGTISRAFGLGTPSSRSSKRNSSSNFGTSPQQGPAPSTQSRQYRSATIQSKVSASMVTVPPALTSLTATSALLSPTPSTTGSTGPPSATAPAGVANALQMGTIMSKESKPPTLSIPNQDQNQAGPLVDRYGFVYDVKVGMKLLRNSRNKSSPAEIESILSLDLPRVPADLNVEDLREALGPSPAVTPQLSKEVAGFGLSPASGSTEASNIGVAADPDLGETNQSIKRLLSQLGEMNDSVEKSQKDGWDAFIKRRKDKMKKAKDEEALALHKKRRATIIDMPLAASTDDVILDEEQYSEHLIGVASMGSDKEDDRAFRKLVRGGIPIIYRPAIWAEVSGVAEIREPGLYQELLDAHAAHASPCLEQIDMDTHRTFPTNIFFAGNGPGVSKLRRLLIAYSWRDPMIGYCQGMNLLAALLLLVYPDEEDAFWMLASVLERILPSDYYSPQLLVSQADQRVLQDLIQVALPELHAHLEDLGVDLPAITFGWFLSLFADALPIQTLLRVWDVLLVHGPIILFKVSIAISKMHYAEIMATDSASTFYVLMTNLTSHLYSVDKLLKIAFDDLKFIQRKDIETRRVKHVADIKDIFFPPMGASSPDEVPDRSASLKQNQSGE